MVTVLIVVGSFVLYLVAYHSYGRFLSRRVFMLDPDRVTPACAVDDGVDFVPSRRSLVFGHHFTSIAGTGPIVGPAIAVVWGWVPALVWVLVGSIFMGAVHDFGSLMISMRHRGRTIADLSGGIVNARVRILFMIVCIIGLWIVLAIFGLVIATIFKLYPSSVVPVFAQIPIAVGLGIWMRRGLPLVLGAVVAVGLMYATIWYGASHVPGEIFPSVMTQQLSVIGWWTLILMVYVFIASVLPVDVLLQPRDFINAWQLLVAMGLLVLGALIAHPPIVADAVRLAPEVSSTGSTAPPMMPFLFITVACGAVSGFHCLVSSGCSSRQLRTEGDAQYVGYGAMLTEGFLAVLVVIACVAGIGMAADDGHTHWMQYYRQWGGDAGLGAKLEPFVVGSANMMEAIGVNHGFAITLMGVFIASFAATTLDSATRLQRYLISELAAPRARSDGTQCAGCGYPRAGLDGSASCPECNGNEWIRKPGIIGRVRLLIANRYGATLIAVVSALAFALSDGFHIIREEEKAYISGQLLWHEDWRQFGAMIYEWRWDQAGLGGLKLWPIFGATNQLLAGLALLVVTVWLVKSERPAWVSAVPMVFMLVMTGYAVVLLARSFAAADNLFLLGMSVVMLVLEIWIIVEAGLLLLRKPKEQPPA
ncbi:MAG: carbon starvation protein A [Phycisphaerales bacterium]|nr:carbon starvation protein A [Phycisphaerales bacterium]